MGAASSMHLWTVAGFVYALAGVALLCNAIFLAPVRSDAVASAWSVPQTNALRRIFAQWLDARIGAALLFVGFFLQMTGAIGTPALNRPAVFVLLVLALAAVYYAFTRDLIIERMADASAEPASDHLERPPPRKLAPPTILVAASTDQEDVFVETTKASASSGDQS